MILLDTNVISELMRAQCSPAVLAFINSQPPTSLFTAAICEAELRYGLARLPDGARRHSLEEALSQFLTDGLRGRILAFDSSSAAYYADIRFARESAGRTITTANAMIAETARAYGVAIATRDVTGFVGYGIDVFNPWNAHWSRA